MSAQAGWYPDPGGGQDLYRYWDGRAWSAATSPHPSAPPPAQGLVGTPAPASVAPKKSGKGKAKGKNKRAAAADEDDDKEVSQTQTKTKKTKKTKTPEDGEAEATQASEEGEVGVKSEAIDAE